LQYCIICHQIIYSSNSITNQQGRVYYVWSDLVDDYLGSFMEKAFDTAFLVNFNYDSSHPQNEFNLKSFPLSLHESDGIFLIINKLNQLSLLVTKD